MLDNYKVEISESHYNYCFNNYYKGYLRGVKDLNIKLDNEASAKLYYECKQSYNKQIYTKNNPIPIQSILNERDLCKSAYNFVQGYYQGQKNTLPSYRTIISRPKVVNIFYEETGIDEDDYSMETILQCIDRYQKREIEEQRSK